MGTPKRINWKSGPAVVVVVALCFATITFGQSTNANHGQALGLGKLEPALEVLNGAKIDPSATASVIVQFLEDEEIIGSAGTKEEIRLAAKLARQYAIAQAGGVSTHEFENLPFHAARVTFGALKRLGAHPHVKRISIDYSINGNLYTTARAVGADQVRPVPHPCPRWTVPASTLRCWTLEWC
jgi:hypothetical protein